MDRATDSMLGELFEQLPDGCFFVLLDAPATHPPDSEALVDHILTSARLVRANAALGRQHGVARARLLGRSAAELPCFAGAKGRAQLRALLEQGSVHLVRPVRALDGRELTIDGRYHTLHDDEGRVLGFLGVQRDITHVRRLQDELEAKATTDPLTGAGNRRLLEERFVDYTAAGAHRITLLYIDLDDFKRVNDRSGHGAGDHALERYAARLRTVLRAGDTLVRVGGDEFVVLAPHASPEDERALLERVAAPAVIDLPESDSVRLSCSVGVVHFPGDGTELPELLDLADRRMYLAKGSGPDAAANGGRPSMPV
jgi:diguanylate cyclase (GGDEF)-like protein/PAS domain S-box-containing protein